MIYSELLNSRLDDTQKENDENQEKSAIGEAESKQLHERIEQAEDRAATVSLKIYKKLKKYFNKSSSNKLFSISVTHL